MLKGGRAGLRTGWRASPARQGDPISLSSLSVCWKDGPNQPVEGAYELSAGANRERERRRRGEMFKAVSDAQRCFRRKTHGAVIFSGSDIFSGSANVREPADDSLFSSSAATLVARSALARSNLKLNRRFLPRVERFNFLM